MLSRNAAIAVASLVALACSSNGDKKEDFDFRFDFSTAEVASDASPAEAGATDLTPEVAQEDVPPLDVPDVFQTGISAKGYGDYCKNYDDCKEFDLLCFNFGPEDVEPFCSAECQSNVDCSVYHVCDYKLGWDEPVKVCRTAQFCAPCQVDSQCMLSGMECVPDASGSTYCSQKCEPGTMGCDDGALCVFVEDRQDWYCSPFGGTCEGDGTQCAPCKVDGDCKDDSYICMDVWQDVGMYSHERYCTKKCAGNEDCELAGTYCAELETGGLCLMTYGDYFVPTCGIATADFCRSCSEDYSCMPDLLCYIGPQSIGHYCTTECLSDAECPEGMQCKSQFSFNTGMPTGKYTCALKPGSLCSQIIENGAAK
jgi:hypothetical protein